jgi:hypothetical protein
MHAAHANPVSGLCSLCQDMFFKPNSRFENISFLAHPLDAYLAIATAPMVYNVRKPEGHRTQAF